MRKSQPHEILLKFVRTKDSCASTSCICMGAQVDTRGLKLHGVLQTCLKSAVVRSRIFWEALLLTPIDAHTHKCRHHLHAVVPPSVTSPGLRKVPCKYKKWEFGIPRFLISDCKLNTSTPRGKAVSVFLLHMAHFQTEITDQRQKLHTLKLPPSCK